MKVKIEKITSHDLILRANKATTGKVSNQPVLNAFLSEHSTIRSQIYWIDCSNIPTFVMGHLVRHNVGVTFYVRSQRIDRGGNEHSDRNTLTSFSFMANAQALISMMRVRLCNKASTETQFLMKKIRNVMCDCDYELGKCFVPTCVARGGICPEVKSCGLNKNIEDTPYSYYKDLF